MSLDSSPSPILSTLQSHLSTLETTLQPLITRQWSDTLLDLDPLQRVKINLLVGYGILDIVWILCKVKGIDPVNHPVMIELERIKSYYLKIQEAENPKIRSQIDISAASRFINHSIPKSQRLTDATITTTTTTSTSTSTSTGIAAVAAAASVPAPSDAGHGDLLDVGRQSRFKHLGERDVKRLEGGVHTDREGIRVIDSTEESISIAQNINDDDDENNQVSSIQSNESSIKRKINKVDGIDHVVEQGKKRRSKVDPFTGQTTIQTPTPTAKPTSTTSTPISSTSSSPTRLGKNAKRKLKRQAEASAVRNS